MSAHELQEIAAAADRLLSGRGEAVLNAIDDGVYCLDARGRTLFVNEAGARMLGYTAREMLGKPQHALIHHHYADGSQFPEEACPIYASVTEGVQQRVGGDTFFRKDGTPLPVDYTSVPVKEGRQVIGAVVTFRDISDQQLAQEQTARFAREHEARREAERAREALIESEERYRFLAESIPVQVWTARPDGTLDHVSARVAEYFGVPREELLENGWTQFVHPEDLPAVVARWTRSLETGEPYETQFRLRRADGRYRRFLVRALPQRDEANRVRRWFGSNTDVDQEVRSPTALGLTSESAAAESIVRSSDLA